MKLRIPSSILLFLSAYSPLSIIFAIQDFDFDKQELTHPMIVWLVLIVSALSCILLWVTMRVLKSSSPPITIRSVDNRLGELINYTVPYMISFFVMEEWNLNLLLSFGVFMLMMFILSLKTHNIFINPMLAIMGYNIYDIHYEKNGHKCKDIFLVKGGVPRKNEQCRIHEISEQLYVVTERNPKV